MDLKNYQSRALDSLRDFLRLAAMEAGFDAAYEQTARRKNADGELINPYADAEYCSFVADLPDCPHVCLRIPTGGGKTLLAAHCAPVAAPFCEELTRRSDPAPWWRPVVLWIVPSNRIRVQTADALQNPRHPCRVAMNDGFAGGIEVYDIFDCRDIPAAAFAEKTCVIVSTIQAIHGKKARGEGADEKTRLKVHAHNENLDPHFSQMSTEAMRDPGLESAPEKYGGGPAHSFANLMRIMRPIVILDEAHNATTEKWKITFPRFRPSCILEFTATPRPESHSSGVKHNVIFNASAEELEREEMIKLPVRLTEHPEGWRQAVAGAVAEQKRLEEIARQHDDAVRPIVLYKAENRAGEATVEEIKNCLLEAESVAEDEIAVATGEIRELDGVDLLDPNCRIRHVITMQALREGWDCPFAYILCSAANIAGATAVEQILGRVLRMPFAQKRAHPDLNCAYAHVPENNFSAAARQLRDKMISMGFEDIDNRFVTPPLPLPETEDGLFSPQGGIKIVAQTKPDFAELDEETRIIALDAVTITARASEGFDVIVDKEIPAPVRAKIIEAVAPEKRETAGWRLDRGCERLARADSPAQREEVFASLPQLQFYFAEEDRYVDAGVDEFYEAVDWNRTLADCVLGAKDFRGKESGDTFNLSLEGGKVVIRQDGHYAPPLIPEDERPTVKEILIGELERDIRDPDGRYDPDALRAFVERNLDALIGGEFSLSMLKRLRRQLAEALKALLKRSEQKALAGAWKTGLFGEGKPPQLSEIVFRFPSAREYQCNYVYNGAYKFRKSYYGVVGDLQDSGEEYQCAVILDSDPGVKHWIRNVPRKPKSFRLPLADGWFYPDFVVELKNGKPLVVEYKGAHLLADAEDKKRVGKKWERIADNRAFFLMPTIHQGETSLREQIRAKIAGICGDD